MADQKPYETPAHDVPKVEPAKPKPDPEQDQADVPGVDPSTGSPTPAHPGEAVGAVHAVHPGIPPRTPADDIAEKAKAEEAKQEEARAKDAKAKDAKAKKS